MDYPHIFSQVASEFDSRTATAVIVVLTIQMAKPIKSRHLENKDLFTKEVIKKANKILWRLDQPTLTTAINCWRALQTYLQLENWPENLGGCQHKTIRQLMAEQSNQTKEVTPNE